MRSRARQRLVAVGLVGGSAAALVPGIVAQDREARYQRFLDLPRLVQDGTVTAHWLADGRSFWYADGRPDSTVLLRVDPSTNTSAQLFDVARVRRAFRAALGYEPPHRGLPFREVTFEPGETAVRVTVEGREWRLTLTGEGVVPVAARPAVEVDRTTARVIRSGAYGGDPDIRELPSPDGRWLATDQGHDIWLRSTADGRLEPLTRDGTSERPWSIATNSQWSESPSTARWSPDGLRLAVVRADYRGVAQIPLVHWLKPVEEVEWRPYVKAGGRLPGTELVIVDVISKQPTTIDLGTDSEHYLVPIGWLPDGSELLCYRMARNYRRLDLLAANPWTGAARLVLRETSETFIKGISSVPAWTTLLTPVGDGRRFLWISERDGWDHLYLYAFDGTMIRRLTSGSFPVLQVVAVDAPRGWVYFTAHAESRRYDTHLYRVGLDGQGFTRLTDGPGEHLPSFSPSREFVVDVHSSLDRPPTTELRAADGRLIRVLARASTDSLQSMGWRPPEEAWVKASDGTTDLRAVIVKPADFDSGQRYPVVENIYGGPQLVYAPRSFGSQAFNQALAQLGFVVVIVDGRGTVERGKAFQDVVYRQFGKNEIPDHVAAIKQLATTRPFMDLDRVGIFGGSWGGYMTIRAMVLAPELYRAGVAIYPVADLIDHWNLIEAYLDLPTANAAGYLAGSSLPLLKNLRGRLLLIHGTSDVNATFSATMKAVDALTRAGKQYDLMVLPEETHAMSPVAVAYRSKALKRFLDEHLSP